MNTLTDYDILILPGWHGSGPEHWQTAWEAEFPNMRRVIQENWEAPRYADWSQRLTEAAGTCKKPVILVGHSLGTTLAVRWALTHSAFTVAGAFLVAPTDIDRFVGDPEYDILGFDPILLAPLPFPAMVVASRNDERVSFERAKVFATAWKARLVDAGTLGHIGSAAKLGLWPQGLVWFGQFLASLESP
ncbi:MAG: serine hydrolase family protein [Betaproteobacteria bacterium]|nr:serine hydrolase family protein [Betaproteobacteria bacterium]